MSAAVALVVLVGLSSAVGFVGLLLRAHGEGLSRAAHPTGLGRVVDLAPTSLIGDEIQRQENRR